MAATPLDPAVAKSTVAADVPARSFTLATGGPGAQADGVVPVEEEPAEDAAPGTQSDGDSTDDSASRPVATGIRLQRPVPNDDSAQRNPTSNGVVESHTTDNKHGSDNGSPTDHATAPHPSSGGDTEGRDGSEGNKQFDQAIGFDGQLRSVGHALRVCDECRESLIRRQL